MDDTTDWKSIALTLGRRVNWAISHLSAKGGGFVANIGGPADEWQHWRDYMADALEMIPGVTVDREVMHLRDLPMSKRKKALQELQARREALAARSE